MIVGQSQVILYQHIQPRLLKSLNQTATLNENMKYISFQIGQHFQMYIRNCTHHSICYTHIHVLCRLGVANRERLALHDETQLLTARHELELLTQRLVEFENREHALVARETAVSEKERALGVQATEAIEALRKKLRGQETLRQVGARVERRLTQEKVSVHITAPAQIRMDTDVNIVRRGVCAHTMGFSVSFSQYVSSPHPQSDSST